MIPPSLARLVVVPDLRVPTRDAAAARVRRYRLARVPAPVAHGPRRFDYLKKTHD